MKRISFILIFIVVFFCSISLFSQSWSSLKRLTWNSGSTTFPDIAVDSNDHLHVIWNDDNSGNREIYYKKSTNGGAAWSSAKRLTWNSGSSLSSRITVDTSDNLHVTWHDFTPGNGEIFHKRSSDSGATWSANKRLSWTSGSTQKPRLICDSGGKLHLVWSDDNSGNSEIYYRQSTNSGISWSSPKRMTWTSKYSYDPEIVVDSSGDPFIVWTEGSFGWDGVYGEIYTKQSLNGGTTWSSPKRMTWTSGDSNDPDISVDSNDNIFIIWVDDTPGNKELFLKRSGNSGTSWSSTNRLTWNAGDSRNEVIRADSGNDLYAFWRDDTPGNFEVYYKFSTDIGVTWSSLKRVTWNSGDARYLDFAFDSSDKLHLVWSDDTPGNYEIYYKNR